MDKYNVRFLFNEEIKDFIVTTTIEGHDKHQRRHVTGILTNENKTINNIDNVILTNGNYVMPLMEKLNIYIPVYPVKVFHFNYQTINTLFFFL
jgi:hypothetical protein